MSKFWESKEFKKLSETWRDKLNKASFNDLKSDLNPSGLFEDIEDSKGRLKQHDLRTQAYEARDTITEYYSRLTRYLDEAKTIEKRDRTILELYLQGAHIEGQTSIPSITGWSRQTVKNVIKKHKSLALNKD